MVLTNKFSRIKGGIDEKNIYVLNMPTALDRMQNERNCSTHGRMSDSDRIYTYG